MTDDESENPRSRSPPTPEEDNLEVLVDPELADITFDSLKHDHVIYQPTKRSKQIVLSREDLDCLNKTKYLNDNIIHFYLT